MFAKSKRSLGTEVHLNFEISNCDPLICTMNYPGLFVSNQMDDFISIRRVRYCENMCLSGLSVFGLEWGFHNLLLFCLFLLLILLYS